MFRRIVSLLALSLTLLAGAAVLAPSASAGAGESDFTARANSERSSRGLRAYSTRSDLVAVARRHAQRMANQNRLYHNPNLGSEVSGWQSLGENVGTGGDVASVHRAFMNSSGHRANILDRDFTEIGVGVVWSGDRLWVVEIFRKPTGATAAPAPAPAPTAQKAPLPRRPAPTATRRPTTTLRRASTAARPAPAPAVTLQARLAAARAAADSSPEGALERAVSWHEVMRTLGG